MADVYKGGIPQTGFNTNLGISSEGETDVVPGGPAKRPGIVKEGGPTQAKTGDTKASEDFLMDPDYKTNMEVGRPTTLDIDNPDDISHADHNDDPDL